MTEGIDKTQPMREAEIAIADWINAHKEDVVNETNRAKAAESTLTTSINNEVTRAKGAESTLTTNLNNEVTRAKGAESTLTTNLNNEVSRAKGAESTLTTNLNNEVSRAKGAESTLTTNLNAEVTRAKAAEKVLTDDLATEVTRATETDATLKTDITEVTDNLTKEVNRATQVESGLQTSINSEYTRASNVETGLSTAITALNNKFPVSTSDIGNQQVTDAKLTAELQSLLSFCRTIPAFEYGYTESITVPSGSAIAYDIEFNEAFAETPQLFITIMCNTSLNLIGHVTFVAADAATIRVFNYGGTAAQNVTVDYLAIGGR